MSIKFLMSTKYPILIKFYNLKLNPIKQFRLIGIGG